MRWLRYTYLFFDDKLKHLREIIIPGTPGVVVAIQDDRYDVEDTKIDVYDVEETLVVRGFVASTQNTLFSVTISIDRRYAIEVTEVPI